MYCDLDLGDMTLGQVHDTPLEKANAKDRRQTDRHGYSSIQPWLCWRILHVTILESTYKLYWKEKETHILTFQTSDLLYEQILSRYQQFIPTNTDY